ncbi:caspase domain-containing protein [Mycena crocata]|nr:caspase domain-containing protein [Mycena crocata]
MKIGRYAGLGYSRRTPIPIPETIKPLPDPPKKKALLIGISYANTGNNDGFSPLTGPHADVAMMQKLLRERYGYAEKDMTVLLDSGEGEQPTRVNILRAIGDLVRGARKGDRFFFHYCGHTTQVVNRSNSEEDGLDECLVPIDGEEHLIMDNELRRHLVDALPVGSSLVAVFDSCHSASLLDLEHFRCNRVYVPWISKGRRRSDERWNAVVRRLALPFSKPGSPSVSRANTATATALSPLAVAANAAAALPTKAKAKLTRRATRETRELAQLVETTRELVGIDETEVGAMPMRDVEEAPTRPATPEVHDAYASPVVTTRRIYEASRTSPRHVRAWRTEVDALEVVGAGQPSDPGVEKEEPVVQATVRAGTEVDGGVDTKRRKSQKRASLPLMPLRLGSFSGRGFGSAKAQGKAKEVDSGATLRRTAVSRARAVSVAVRPGSGSGGGSGSRAGKENADVKAARPSLRVAVPVSMAAAGALHAQDTPARPVSWLGEDGEDFACDSPEAVYPCQGWCAEPGHGHPVEPNKADVVSLASCKDYQLSWEDANGGSMTSELVRILERDPHPTIRSLVTRVSHALHRMTLERHIETRRYKREMKVYEAWQKRHPHASRHVPTRASSSTSRPSGSPSLSVSGVSTPAPATPDISRTQSTSSASEPPPPATVTVADAPQRIKKHAKKASVAPVDFATRHMHPAAHGPVSVPVPPKPLARAVSEGLPEYDMANFQNPEVASHWPLNMDKPWTM